MYRIDTRRAFETTRTTFGIIGATGYAAYIVEMHSVMCILSLSLMSATWYAIYRVMEKSQ